MAWLQHIPHIVPIINGLVFVAICTACYYYGYQECTRAERRRQHVYYTCNADNLPLLAVKDGNGKDVAAIRQYAERILAIYDEDMSRARDFGFQQGERQGLIQGHAPPTIITDDDGELD